MGCSTATRWPGAAIRCPPDTDGDGLLDGDELALGTLPDVADSDQDGLDDADEFRLGTQPLGPDSDADGLLDGEEVHVVGSDPLVADSDADGCLDGVDATALVADPDLDGDGLGDGCELCTGLDATGDADADGTCDDLDVCAAGDDAVDVDGDGIPDACDACQLGDDALDADGDRIPDACDVCVGDDTLGDADADGVCDDLDACAAADDTLDADADGVPDACDVCAAGADGLDADLDGVADACDVCPDHAEDDPDGDGFCGFALTAFVTSTTHPATFGGSEGADQACQDAADAAGHEGTFRAWVSDAFLSASTQLLVDGADGPWVRPDGEVVAESRWDLVDGTLAAPLDMTEWGDDYSGDVWTGTLADGSITPAHCSNWQGGTFAFGAVGTAGATDGAWTDAAVVGCQTVEAALYCFEVP